METYKTKEAIIARISELLDNDPSPYYEGKLDWWINKYSEVDLIITDRGPVEQHDELYRGHTYEITITTRAFKDEEIRKRYMDYDGCDE
jgi:hypothetical protein